MVASDWRLRKLGRDADAHPYKIWLNGGFTLIFPHIALLPGDRLVEIQDGAGHNRPRRHFGGIELRVNRRFAGLQ